MPYIGHYGLALLPGKETREGAIYLSKLIRPNELDLGGKHHPHMTLYHARFRELPDEVVDDLMSRLAPTLPLKVQMFRIMAYAKKFVFWDARRTPELEAMHRASLELAAYLAPEAGAIGTETLSLSPREMENIRTYGHPLVKELWRPHVTIGYHEDGYPYEEDRRYDVRFDKVALIRVGEYGTAQEILRTLP